MHTPALLLRHFDLTDNTGFLGIGTATHPFSGEFDGRGHKVRLNINTPTESNIALFRHTDNAAISSITIAGSIKSVSNTGAIAGSAANQTRITNCISEATIESTTTNTGGIAGHTQYSIIENCTTKATIKGTTNTGGITGLSEASTIIANCQTEATSNITGSNQTGGITGKLSTSSITNCTVNSPITKSPTTDNGNGDYTGGITGYSENSTITNSTANSSITARNYSGGIAGYLTSTNAATPAIIEGCTVTGKLTFQNPTTNLSAGIAGCSQTTNTGALIIRSTYFKGDITSHQQTGIFTGYTTSKLTIEDSGYIITADLTPPNAAITIDNTTWPEPLITRASNNKTTIKIPITKQETTAITGDSYEKIAFTIGSETKEYEISNKTKTNHTLNLGKVTLHIGDSNTKLSSIESPANADINNALYLITATADTKTDKIPISITPATPSTWALYKDAACTDEITDKTLPLTADTTTAYIKVTSENGNNAKIYTIIITRAQPHPGIVTGLFAVSRENEVQLTWNTPDTPDTSNYNIYRSTSPNSGFIRIATTTSQQNTSYTDKTATQEYYYKVSAVNSQGTEGPLSAAVSAKPLTDKTPPEITAISPKSGAEIGQNPQLSAVARDNTGISAIHIEYQDKTTNEWHPIGKITKTGTNISGAVTWYNTAIPPGIITVRYYADDLSGNRSAYNTATYTIKDPNTPPQTATATIEIRDAKTNTPIPHASIYAELEQPEQSSADSTGKATLTAPEGSYTVYFYAEGYQPEARQITLTKINQTTITIHLKQTELITGGITTKKLTLAEIESLGIDTTDPSNHHIYEFEIEITIAGYSYKEETIYIRDDGKILDENKNWQDPANTGKYGSTPGTGSTANNGANKNIVGELIPKVITYPDPDIPPTLAILHISGSAAFLKEFFEVTLIIQNTAPDSKFKLENNTARITLPPGLSLAPIFGGQSAEIKLPPINNSETASATWIITGESQGEYHITAEYSGQLQPFGSEVSAQFKPSTPFYVNGGEGLTMSIRPAKEAFKGQDYKIPFTLTNTSSVPFYYFTITFNSEQYGTGTYNAYKTSSITVRDGESIFIRELAPGESITGTYITVFNTDLTGENILHQLMGYTIYLNQRKMQIDIEWDENGDNTSDNTGNSNNTGDDKTNDGEGTADDPNDNNDNNNSEANNYTGIPANDEESIPHLHNDPVDIINGNLIWHYTDIEAYGARRLSFTRHYNSQDKNKTTLGTGWRHSFDYTLQLQDQTKQATRTADINAGCVKSFV